MDNVVSNPFGAPPRKNSTKGIKSFLAVLTKEMGLYKAYNSDHLVKAYHYCRNELGDDFETYLKCVRRHIRKQDADYQKGKVSIYYLNDVFTKFPKIITQLKKEGKWDGDYPDGWSVDSTGAPYHKDYQLISRSIEGFTYVSKKPGLDPLNVVYNRDKNEFIKIDNMKTGEVIWAKS